MNNVKDLKLDDSLEKWTEVVCNYRIISSHHWIRRILSYNDQTAREVTNSFFFGLTKNLLVNFKSNVHYMHAILNVLWTAMIFAKAWFHPF